MKTNRLYNFLALAGTLPFIASAVLLFAGVESVPIMGQLDQAASSYGLVIVSFMAGTHWGIDLSRQKYMAINLKISSNAIALFVWFAYLGASVTVAITCQVMAFLALLGIDHRMRACGIISNDYFRIRLIATVIVSGALIAVILN